MHKRSFLLGACGAALGPAAGAASLAGTAPVLHAALPALGAAPGAAHWQAYVDQPFELRAEGRSVAVRLARVAAVPAAAGTEQFVLGFVGAAALPTGLYELAHANGERQSLSLTAQGDAQQASTQLRAEFNLLSASA